MLKTTTHFDPVQFGGAALAASRKVWLAGLGATAVTRDWVQTEAGDMFKTLVKEGTAVESRAIRFVEDQIESSVTRANTAWKRTRRTFEASVRQAANVAVDLAQQVVPRTLPMFEVPVSAKVAKPARKAKRTTRAPAKAKRRAKAAVKGA